MEDPNDKIALDDIVFDDILDGGVPMEADIAAPEVEEEIKEPEVESKQAADKELEDDSKSRGDEDLEEEDYTPSPERKGETVEDSAKESEEVSNTVVGDILEKLGYETEEAYDDTTEGLLQLTQDVGARMAEDQLDQLFEKFPLVRNHLEYVLAGGQSQQFMKAYDPTNDYSQMNVSEKDITSQRTVLSDYFKAKGHDQEFIDEILEDYQDSGKLFTKATKAQEVLAKAQTEQRTAMVEKQKQQRAEAAQKQKEFWNGVYETIENSTEFAGLTVPKREKNKFFNYISTPVTREGHTQRDIDHQNAEMDIKLAIDYLMFKGFKLDDIIKTKAKTSSAKSLRAKISKNDEKLKSAKRASRKSNKAVDLDDLDLNF